MRPRQYSTPPQLDEVFEKIRNERNLRQGQASNLKGRVAEERVLRAALRLCEETDWLYIARLATSKEDESGIDVVVYSSIGKLYIQVKSSHCGARKFRSKRPLTKVIVVIIDGEMSSVKIEHKVYDALCRLRCYFSKGYT